MESLLFLYQIGKKKKKQQQQQQNRNQNTNFLHIKQIHLYIKESTWGQKLTQMLFKSGKMEFKKDIGGLQALVQKGTLSIMKICLEPLWSLSVSGWI